MRILLLGGTGQVGEEFRALPLPNDVVVVAPNRTSLDFQNSGSIGQIIASEPWNVVINAAAYTNVDRAESEEAMALAVNGTAPTRFAVETARRGIPFVHISSDYVFDGRKGDAYTETDDTAPLNAYGRTKLAGENGVRAGNPRHVILRSSWVFSPYRSNFVRTILRLAAERDRLTVVQDQLGCPTAARDIAQACLVIALRCASKPESSPYGTYHFAGAGATNWFDFARAIVDLAAGRLNRKPPVLPIRTVDYPTPAQRPADSRLACSTIVGAFGIKPQPWRPSLASTIDRILDERDGS